MSNKKSQLTIIQITKLLNEFRTAYPDFSKSEFVEYCTSYKIPYTNFLLSKLAEHGIVTRVSYGQYSWQSTPVHVERFKHVFEECKNYVTSCFTKDKKKEEIKPEPKNLQDSLIEMLEAEGLVIKHGEKVHSVSKDQAITILKSLGYRIFRPVSTLEEI